MTTTNQTTPTMTKTIHPAFGFHKLNTIGQTKAQEIAEIFTDTEEKINQAINGDRGSTQPGGRYYALMMTKLEEASFFAKKAVATQTEYQETTNATN